MQKTTLKVKLSAVFLHMCIIYCTFAGRMLTQLLTILFAFFVQFTDKAGSEQIALSQFDLNKRAERNIAIDSLDYAVSPVYPVSYTHLTLPTILLV